MYYALGNSQAILLQLHWKRRMLTTGFTRWHRPSLVVTVTYVFLLGCIGMVYACHGYIITKKFVGDAMEDR